MKKLALALACLALSCVSFAQVTIQNVNGNTGTTTISTTAHGTFNSAVVLSVNTTLPTGITAGFGTCSPNGGANTIAAPGTGTCVLTFTVGATASVGTYPVQVKEDGGVGNVILANLTLIITNSSGNTLSGGTSPSNSPKTWNVCDASTQQNGSTTGGIAECLNNAGNCGGTANCTIVLPAAYAPTITGCPIAISVNNVTIKGEGAASGFNLDCGGDLFQITASNFFVHDFEITNTHSTSRTGALFNLTNAAASNFRPEHMVFNGLASVANNGDIVYSNTQGVGVIRGQYWNIPGGVMWNSFVKLVSPVSATLSMPSNSFTDIASSAGCVDGCVVFDGYMDSVWLSNLDFEPAASNPAFSGPDIWLRNTNGVSNQPRWIHCVNCFLSSDDTSWNGSAGNNTPMVKLDYARDFQMIGGIVAGPGTGIAIGANAMETKIHDVEFPRNATGAITVANGAVHTMIHDNQFSDVCGATNATYNAIDVAAGVTNFSIHDNEFRYYANNNKCLNAISVATGAANQYQLDGNNIPSSSYTGSSIVNNGSGGTQLTIGNLLFDDHYPNNITFAGTVTSSGNMASQGTLSSVGALTTAEVLTGTASNRDLAGKITLAAGAGSYTFLGSYSNPPNCWCNDQTTPANVCNPTTSTTTLTLAGTGTDVVVYGCVGRN